MFIRFREVFPNFVRKILLNKYQISTFLTLFTLFERSLNYFVVWCLDIMFLRHILYWKQTYILPIKFSKLRLMLRILTCSTSSFSKYYVLRRYGFTLVVVLVISLKKVCVWVPFIKLSERASFININRDIFRIFPLRNHFDIS